MAAPMARCFARKTFSFPMLLSRNASLPVFQNRACLDLPRVPTEATPVSQFVLSQRRQFSTCPALMKSIQESSCFSTSAAINADEQSSEDAIALMNEAISHDDVGRLFAIVHVKGHQRKVTQDDIITIPTHIPADVGERIRLEKVMLVGGKDFTLVGRPLLSRNQVKVEATVLEKTLSNVRVSFRYLRRQDNKKLRLHQYRITHLRINSVEVLPLTQV